MNKELSKNDAQLTNKKKHAQYFTSDTVAFFLSSLATPILKNKIRILDPGAGIGTLSVSLINWLTAREKSIQRIELKVVEIDSCLIKQLEETLEECKKLCYTKSVEFTYEIINNDFLEISYAEVYETKSNAFFTGDNERLGLFDYIIMNPPYKKINNSSTTRKILDYLEEESTNIYTAFLSLASYLLLESGQLIAITPRSFCNGSYYKKFRDSFFTRTYFHRIHIYSSRNKAFQKDKILQENILFVVSPQKPKNNSVLITSNNSPDDTTLQTITVDHNLVIIPGDENKVVHIITDEYSVKIIEKISVLSHRLSDAGIDVSTGKVVDFRIREELTSITESNAAALFYPFHLDGGEVVWPRYTIKKKEAIFINQITKTLLVKAGYYVFCRRFSSKEEKRRIVAAFFDARRYGHQLIGIENHLNYFHINNKPLTRELARGLTAFLNSTIVDQYFRLFNGHTQVNAEDLRYIPIPGMQQLEDIGNTIEDLADQDEIDLIIEQELFEMKGKENPVIIKKRIEEALSVLTQLGLPKDQQNERSALTFLSLLNLKPEKAWSKSKPTMLGITAIMSFIKENYHKEYAPNSRESIRRQTVHQFIQAGIIIANPDKPCPVNSPNFVYQIEEHTLELVKTFKTSSWESNLRKYLSKIKTLVSIYEQKRELNKITLRVAEEVNVYLSSGGQNKLIEKIIKDFCEYFTPKGTLIYIGDAKSKWTYFNEQALSKIGVKIKDVHGKMPDLIIHYKEKNWLLLIEAVTSHGPIDPKRKIELEQLFGSSKAGLVFITSFLNKKDMVKHINKIAWETEVWVAENPTHLVHLNGKRFLGPYSKS